MKNQCQWVSKPIGSKGDRHDSLGDGLLGSNFFVKFINDFRFNGIPIILEAPGDGLWTKEIVWLRSQLN